MKLKKSEVAEALAVLGYNPQYDGANYFFKSHHHNDIKVRDTVELSELLQTMYLCGQTDKCWEIKRVLQVG